MNDYTFGGCSEGQYDPLFFETGLRMYGMRMLFRIVFYIRGVGVLYQPPLTINEYGVVTTARIVRGNWSNRRNPGPVPHVSLKSRMTRPCIEPGPPRWESWPLTAWGMTRPWFVISTVEAIGLAVGNWASLSLSASCCAEKFKGWTAGRSKWAGLAGDQGKRWKYTSDVIKAL
jgi:hypothetical protein